MMYQLRDLRVRHLDADAHGDATWSMETRKGKCWEQVPCYKPALEYELRELAERSVKRAPGIYKLPIESSDTTAALAALFSEFQTIEEVDE